jgi:hypothetical protein
MACNQLDLFSPLKQIKAATFIEIYLNAQPTETRKIQKPLKNRF